MSIEVERVRWTADNGAERSGLRLRDIPPNEVPTLPPGVSKRRRRFRASASLEPRVLVLGREEGTGDVYYAPRVGSLEEALDETREAVSE